MSSAVRNRGNFAKESAGQHAVNLKMQRSQLRPSISLPPPTTRVRCAKLSPALGPTPQLWILPSGLRGVRSERFGLGLSSSVAMGKQLLKVQGDL